MDRADAVKSFGEVRQIWHFRRLYGVTPKTRVPEGKLRKWKTGKGRECRM